MIDKAAMISGLMGTASAGASALTKPEQVSDGSFGEIIGQMLESASAASAKSADLNKRLQMDDPSASVEDVAIASNISSLQFTAVVQTRNKILQAYNDIMNMPV